VLGISDFTVLKGEAITVAGEVLEHRLFHFRLPFSGWCYVVSTDTQKVLTADTKKSSLLGGIFPFVSTMGWVIA
jgi:hypothetical protein